MMRIPSSYKTDEASRIETVLFFFFLVAKDVHTVWPSKSEENISVSKVGLQTPVWGRGESSKESAVGVSIHPHSTSAETADRGLCDSSRHPAVHSAAHIPSITSLLISHFPCCPKQKIDLCQIFPVNMTPQSALPFYFYFSVHLYFLSIPLTRRLPLALSSQPRAVEESDFPPVSFKYSWMQD